MQENILMACGHTTNERQITIDGLDVPVCVMCDCIKIAKNKTTYYKGFVIGIKKESEGYSILCYRKNDGWILVDEWNPSLKTAKEALQDAYVTIDDYLENPEYYE